MKVLLRVCILFLMPYQALAALTTSVTLVTGQPTAIFPGEQTQLEITLGNSNTGSDITGVAFNTALPAGSPDGLEISGVPTYQCTDPSGPSTGGGAGTLTATINTQAIKLVGGTIPARANNTDGTCTIIIPVTAGTSTGGAATYTYAIADAAVTGTDGAPVSNSGTVSQSVGVLALTQPTISKSFSSSTVRLGDSSSTLTIVVSNNNSVVIPNFSITDTFPVLGVNAIIKVAAIPNASANCNNGGAAPTFNPVAGAFSVMGTGTVPAKLGNSNGRCTFSVDIEAASTDGSYSTGAQTNRIDRSTDFTNDIGIPAASDATRNITVQSPLTVSKSFASTVLSSGEADSFTITLNNAANSPLTITTFTDSPIDGLVGIGGGTGVLGSGLVATAGSTTCAGGAVDIVTSSGDGMTLTGGTIPANGSCTVTINFTAAAQSTQIPVTYTNTIAEGTVGVSTPGIISQARSASVLVADELRVLKTATPAQAAPGNPVRYSVTVQNFSTTVINNVTIDDSLPANFTYLTGVINGNDFDPSLSAACGPLTEASSLGDSSAQFTVATLPARSGINSPSSCTVNFWVMVDPNAADNVSTVNTINANEVCYNAGVTCNGSGANSTPSTTRTEATVFSATKRFNGSTSPVTLSEGTIATLSVTLTNISANPLTNVTLSDTFPIDGSGQLQIANPANGSTTCGGTITAVAGTSSLALNGATVPARANNGTGANGSCVLNVDVIGPAGTYDNIAQLAGTQTFANGSTGAISQFGTNTARLVYLSSLAASKSFTPASVSSGGQSRVTVRLSNAGAVALTNVSVTDPLPTGMVLANPVNASTSCAGSPVFTAATVGADTITMQGASIAGNGSCDMLFDVVVTGAANWTNTIPSGNITADGGVRNVTAVSAVLNYQSPTSISVAKATNPSTLTFPGQTSQLTITITNGNLAVTSLSFTDFFTLDGTSGTAVNGMAISSTPNASTTCVGGVVSAVAGAAQVSLSGVSLAASASCTVTADVTSTAVGGITNFIPMGAISTDQGLSNSGQATTSLTTQSNIGVVKKFTPNVVKPGERSRLRISFFNPTTQPMANVSVTDTLPVGVTVPSGANPVTTCTGATVTSPAANQVHVSGGNIIASSGTTAESCYAEIDVIVAIQGDYVNTIPSGGVTAIAGGNPVSNSQPTSDTLSAKAPLLIHKAFTNKTLDSGNPVGFTTGSDSTTPGVAVTMTVRLDNPNGLALTGATFVDSLPANLVVAQTPNASTTCVGGFVNVLASATTVQLAGATIPASGFCTVTVDLLSNISGSYTNTVPSTAVTTNEGVSNEEPTSAELVVATPPVIDKQFSPSVIPGGGTSTLTIIIENSNSGDITLTNAFVDSLPTAPGNIVVATPSNITKTCPGVVTAAAGAGTVSYANGSVVPAGGCTINVDVTGVTTGEHINNIPAGDLQTTAGVNQQPANASLLISPLGFISGKVFQDNNVTPNGSFDSGTDTPIAGVSIELHAGANCSAPLAVVSGVINPATTDSQGNYLFATLPAGAYSVCEPIQPSGTDNGATTAGLITSTNSSTGTVGTASNPTSTTSQVINININDDGLAGEISGSGGNNFSEVAPSTISGMAFLDDNNNGVLNGADTAIAGVTIELLDNTNTLIGTTITDANGVYSFTGLVPGTYSVREPSQPANTSNGQTIAGTVGNGGTAGTASGISTLPSLIASIILPPNTSAEANNFAEIPQGRRISGVVFLDFDNSGAVNGPDHGIGGQTINLTGADINSNAVSLTTSTASDGSYSFSALPEGTYTVTQPSQPTGTSSGITTAGNVGGVVTIPAVTPSVIATIPLTGTNTVSAENNFAEIPDASVDLAITKTHSPASFGAGSNTGFYTITPSNIGTLDTSGVITIVDTLPAGMTAFAWPTSGAWVCSVVGQIVTCTSSQVITANGGVGSDIILRVAVTGGLEGQILVNNVVISGGNEPPGFEGNNDDDDPTTVAAAAAVEGNVWRDTDHDRVKDVGETLVEGWSVQLLLNDQLMLSTTTDLNGHYSFSGLAPGSGYRVRFLEPSSGAILGQPIPNEQGGASTSGVIHPVHNPAGAEHIDGSLNNLTLLAGTTTLEQSLPLDPSGVVYDSVTRAPITGATVTLLDGGAPVPNNCLVGANNNQVTGALGFYQFLLINPAPVGCLGNGVYTLQVTEPAGYLPAPSSIIPEAIGSPYTPIADVAPNVDAIQLQPTPPTGAELTTYYFGFNLTLGGVGVVNNHLPIDPILEGAIIVSKTTPKKDVVRGELVPYNITATNTLSATLVNIALQDQIPAGFKYVKGSATINGAKLEPTVAGRNLSWGGLTFISAEVKTIQLILIIGSGVGEGEYVNQAWANNTVANARVSNIGSAMVRVVPDPLFDCSDLIGKVFDDQNINGYQDKGESGLAGIRVATVRGLLVTTDDHGRFHIACADVPNELHGSNFIMKLDERTLPSGYRVTTENPRVVRMTRGKLGKLNFGAALHRVIRVDLNTSSFNEKGDELTSVSKKQLTNLIQVLKDQPSLLRLTYVMSQAEDKSEARQRMKLFVSKTTDAWQQCDCNNYELTIEEELLASQLSRTLQQPLKGEK